MDYLKKALQAASDSLNKIKITRPVSDDKSPREILIFRFSEFCRIIDHSADLENANSVEADKALHESKVREHIKVIISILQQESELWVSNSLEIENRSPRWTESDKKTNQLENLPCISTFISRKYVHEICVRAQRDLPRGCWP